MENIFNRIEAVVAQDKGCRGIKALVVCGEMERAARSLLEGTTVFITTGFYIRYTGRGETDGPPGAIALARALDKLGKEVVMVADGPNVPLLRGALDAVGPDIPLVLFPKSASSSYAVDLLEKYKPTHVIALERVGPARDGKYYNMRGEDISCGVAPMDMLFTQAAKRGITTIGIGDGGNEIGMGKVFNNVVDSVHCGREIACVIPTDYLIVGGVSNWAGHGLCACLSILSGKNLMIDEDTERRLMKVLVESGAVDGCTLQPTETVDSLALDEYLYVISELREIVEGYISRR